MARGQVNVHNINQFQGPIAGIERRFLYIGLAPAGKENTIVSLNSQTDFDDVFGDADTALKRNVYAASLNAGQNWEASVGFIAADGDWRDMFDEAQLVSSFEAVVLCQEVDSKIALTDAHAKMVEAQSKYGRWCFAMVAVKGIEKATQTWSDYETAAAAIVKDVAAPLVLAVPLTHQNNLGVLAGRLCNRSVTVADSPMRVATGPVVGLGESDVDKAGKPISEASLVTLEQMRYAMAQHYADYPGTFWSDGNMLDAPGGDYQVVENVRVVHKASRKIRFLAIARVADRKLNSTPASIEQNKTFFMRPLREMSKSATLNGVTFPGEVKPPKAEDIAIIWPTKYAAKIYITVRPYGCAKTIDVYIGLDLKVEGE